VKRPLPRPAVALILTAAAVFTLLAPRCGLLGQLLSACLARLLGTPGTALLVVTLLALAVAVGAPGLLTRLAQRLVNAKPKSVNAKPEVVNVVRPTRERRALQDVRTALKNLGYVKNEIDPVVDALDPTMSLEKAVKAALQQLNVN
jgi:hypothetical protein